jgi:hypothetical protein
MTQLFLSTSYPTHASFAGAYDAENQTTKRIIGYQLKDNKSGRCNAEKQ